MRNGETGTEWYKRIEREITAGQDELRKNNSDHSLLKLVEVTSYSIDYHFTGIYGVDYLGLTTGEAIDKYILDVRNAITTENSSREEIRK